MTAYRAGTLKRQRCTNDEIKQLDAQIAINEIQVEVYDLPTKLRKDGDKRSQQVAYTVEAEAMPAHILRSLLVAEIDALLPAHALNLAKLAEQSEKAHLARMAKPLRRAR